MNTRELESLRQQFPVGARVVLEKMDDQQAPPIGTKGTVTGVDDIGSIMVKWDNGSSLNVAYGEDICKKLNPLQCRHLQTFGTEAKTQIHAEQRTTTEADTIC